MSTNTTILVSSVFVLVSLAVVASYFLSQKGDRFPRQGPNTENRDQNSRGNAFGTVLKLSFLLLVIGLIVLVCFAIEGWIHQNGMAYRSGVAEEAARQIAQAEAQAQAVRAPQTWHGLLNATEYSLELSTNWSRTLPKPAGMKSRWNLSLQGLQVQANESTLLRADGFTSETDIRNLRFRLSENSGIQSTNLLVAFGH